MEAHRGYHRNPGPIIDGTAVATGNRAIFGAHRILAVLATFA